MTYPFRSQQKWHGKTRQARDKQIKMETKRKTRTYVIQSDGIIAKIKGVDNKAV